MQVSGHGSKNIGGFLTFCSKFLATEKAAPAAGDPAPGFNIRIPFPGQVSRFGGNRIHFHSTGKQFSPYLDIYPTNGYHLG